jgi:hypothetical protein
MFLSLQVTYKGNNDEAVFGEYTCLASNTIGINNITLSMLKAGKSQTGIPYSEAALTLYSIVTY